MGLFILFGTAVTVAMALTALTALADLPVAVVVLLSLLLLAAVGTAAGLWIYFLVWRWQAHHEVYRQFQLEHEGRKKGTLWFVLGCLGLVVGGPFLLFYDWIWVSNLQHVRQRLGLPQGITPARYLVLNLASSLGLLLLALGAQFGGLGAEATDAQALALALAFILIFGGGYVASAVSYALVQRDTNQVWRLGAALMRYGPVLPHATPYPPAHPYPPPMPYGYAPPPQRPVYAPPASAPPPPPPQAPPASSWTRLRCPRCASVVVVPAGRRPSCSTCGYA